jgi:hypothetical protein
MQSGSIIVFTNIELLTKFVLRFLAKSGTDSVEYILDLRSSH